MLAGRVDNVFGANGKLFSDTDVPQDRHIQLDPDVQAESGRKNFSRENLNREVDCATKIA